MSSTRIEIETEAAALMLDRICETLVFLGKKVASDLLEAEPGSPKKINLREDSISDNLLLEIIKAHPKPELYVVRYSNTQEGRTGADWKWTFVFNGSAISFHIQAKKPPIRTNQRQHKRLLSSEHPFYCVYSVKTLPNSTPTWLGLVRSLSDESAVLPGGEGLWIASGAERATRAARKAAQAAYIVAQAAMALQAGLRSAPLLPSAAEAAARAAEEAAQAARAAAWAAEAVGRAARAAEAAAWAVRRAARAAEAAAWAVRRAARAAEAAAWAVRRAAWAAAWAAWAAAWAAEEAAREAEEAAEAAASYVPPASSSMLSAWLEGDAQHAQHRAKRLGELKNAYGCWLSSAHNRSVEFPWHCLACLVRRALLELDTSVSKGVCCAACPVEFYIKTRKKEAENLVESVSKRSHHKSGIDTQLLAFLQNVKMRIVVDSIEVRQKVERSVGDKPAREEDGGEGNGRGVEAAGDADADQPRYHLFFLLSPQAELRAE